MLIHLLIYSYIYLAIKKKKHFQKPFRAQVYKFADLWRHDLTELTLVHVPIPSANALGIRASSHAQRFYRSVRCN